MRFPITGQRHASKTLESPATYKSVQHAVAAAGRPQEAEVPAAAAGRPAWRAHASADSSKSSYHNTESSETRLRSRKELPMGHETKDHSSQIITSTKRSGNGNSPSISPFTQVKQRNSYTSSMRQRSPGRSSHSTHRFPFAICTITCFTDQGKRGCFRNSVRSPRQYGVVQQGLCDYAASLTNVVIHRHCRYHRQNHNERGRHSRLRRRRHHHPHGHTYGILVTIIVIVCTRFSMSGY